MVLNDGAQVGFYLGVRLQFACEGEESGESDSFSLDSLFLDLDHVRNSFEEFVNVAHDVKRNVYESLLKLDGHLMSFILELAWNFVLM